mmetsp:Transcript_43844/g.64391  ORF Transcript_43844/g.64391 Transcript_43844/m.64391 type:complete len:258 (-) Transcript_43844:474-1247(-)
MAIGWQTTLQNVKRRRAKIALLSILICCAANPIYTARKLLAKTRSHATTDQLSESVQSSTSTNEIVSSNDGGPAIAVLLPNLESEVTNILNMIRSLDRYIPDDRQTPILVFNEGNLNASQTNQIIESTTRQIYFPFVNFTEFPEGFDPARSAPKNFSTKKRTSKWGYNQMCRFWITNLWEHDIVVKGGYSTIMRMDTDSCLISKIGNESIPHLKSEKILYKSNTPHQNEHEYEEVSAGLMDLVDSWVYDNNIVSYYV